MIASAKIFIVLIFGAICTWVAFAGLSKLLDMPDNAPQYRPTTEVTFERENTSKGNGERIDRPVRAETKRRALDYEDIVWPPVVTIPYPVFPSTKLKPGMPIVRPPPIMPPRAKKSGSCTFDLAIDVRGQPKSVNNLKCTESIFIEPTQISVKKWVFSPKIEEGRVVVFSSLDHKITYKQTDEKGNVIPE